MDSGESAEMILIIRPMLLSLIMNYDFLFGKQHLKLRRD